MLSLPTDAPASTSRSTNVHNTESFKAVSCLKLTSMAYLGTQHCAYWSLPRLEAQKCKEMPGLPLSAYSNSHSGVCLHGRARYRAVVLSINMQMAASSHASRSDTKWITTILRCSQKMGSCFQLGIMDTDWTSLDFSSLICEVEPIIPASKGWYQGPGKCCINGIPTTRGSTSFPNPASH